MTQVRLCGKTIEKIIRIGVFTICSFKFDYKTDKDSRQYVKYEVYSSCVLISWFQNVWSFLVWQTVRESDRPVSEIKRPGLYKDVIKKFEKSKKY